MSLNKKLLSTYESHLNHLISTTDSVNSANYMTFHKKRYAFLLAEVSALIDQHFGHEACSILDVGPAFQTNIMRKVFPAMVVNTIGINNPVNNLRVNEKHYHVDFNKTEFYKDEFIQHDMILFAEVIEHLYTKPEVVIAFLTKFLKPNGMLIIQTPNAAATFKRLLLLFGRHPYELIKLDRMGHYREYTLSELKNILNTSGFDVHKSVRKNYFNYHLQKIQVLYGALNRLMPGSFKDGITIIGRKR